MSTEVEDTIKRIMSHKGVTGVLVLNAEGVPIKSTITDNLVTTQYAALFSNFLNKAKSSVKDLDPQNDLTFLRVRTKKNEIMIAPDKEYMMIVIQNAQ